MSRKKSGNGDGDSLSILITFNPDSEVEMRALEVARYLATPHGRRKHAFVAFLNAVGDYVELTGKEFHPDDFAAMFMSSVLSPTRDTAQEYEPIVNPIESDGLLKTGTSTGVSADTIASNFFDDMEDLDI
jgi:hypothetical protein